MTVGELIEKLKEYPADWQVCVPESQYNYFSQHPSVAPGYFNPDGDFNSPDEEGEDDEPYIVRDNDIRAVAIR